MIRGWRAGIAIAGMAMSGCATGGIGAYTDQRLADLAEVAHFSVGSGKGLSIDARIGALSQPAIGIYGAKTVAFGLLDPDVRGFIAETRVSAPYAFGYARENGASWLEALNFSGWRTSYAVTRLQRGFEEVDKPLAPLAPREYGETIEGRRYGAEITGGRWLPLPSYADRFEPPLQFKTATEFSVGGHVAIFAARGGVNLLEFVDFVLGFAGIDIAQDDVVRDFSARSAFPRGAPLARVGSDPGRVDPEPPSPQGSALLDRLLSQRDGARSGILGNLGLGSNDSRARPAEPAGGRLRVIVNQGYSAVAQRPGRSSPFSAVSPGTR